MWNVISWGIWYVIVIGFGHMVIEMIKNPHDWFD